MPVLELLRADHAAALLAFERDNRAFFAASISDRGDEYFATFDDQLAALLADQELEGAYFVLVDDDGAVLGRFNLGFRDGGVTELGYRVAERVAGQGVATATVRELCARAAREYAVTEVVAATSRGNVASQRVLAKAGFVETGPADPSEIGGKQGSWYRLDITSGA